MYYTVESQLWRRKIGNKLDNWINELDFSAALLKTKKEFYHSSPIEARKAAFDYYQSMIDVLYDGLGKVFTDDYQARIDLQYYLDSNNDTEFGSATKFKTTDDFLNGIEVYMILEKPQKVIRTNNKYCIHGIRYIDYPERLDEDLIASLKNLLIENQYYEEYNYTTDKEKVLKHFDLIGGGAEFFLQTPFDWDAFMEDFEGIEILKNYSL